MSCNAATVAVFNLGSPEIPLAVPPAPDRLQARRTARPTRREPLTLTPLFRAPFARHSCHSVGDRTTPPAELHTAMPTVAVARSQAHPTCSQRRVGAVGAKHATPQSPQPHFRVCPNSVRRRELVSGKLRSPRDLPLPLLDAQVQRLCPGTPSEPNRRP